MKKQYFIGSDFSKKITLGVQVKHSCIAHGSVFEAWDHKGCNYHVCEIPGCVKYENGVLKVAVHVMSLNVELVGPKFDGSFWGRCQLLQYQLNPRRVKNAL